MKKIKLILILIASLIITSCCSLPKEVNPVKALKQIDDGLYLLDYIGDYDFDNFLAQGGAKSNAEIATLASYEAVIVITYTLVMIINYKIASTQAKEMNKKLQERKTE